MTTQRTISWNVVEWISQERTSNLVLIGTRKRRFIIQHDFKVTLPFVNTQVNTEDRLFGNNLKEIKSHNVTARAKYLRLMEDRGKNYNIISLTANANLAEWKTNISDKYIEKYNFTNNNIQKFDFIYFYLLRNLIWRSCNYSENRTKRSSENKHFIIIRLCLDIFQ